MSSVSVKLPREQQAIQARCFHPSGTFVEFDKKEIEQSIPDCFEKVVRRYPNRLAAKTQNNALSYDSLNKAANRVARAILDKFGAQIEPAILLSEQGPGTILSCLGILKAGKILIAVDPSFPVERLAYILEDSQAGAVLTESKNLSLAMALAKTARQVVNIDALDKNFSDEDIGLQLSADAPAEIRYTSGSTGQPKGIVRNHRRLLHNTMLIINTAHICPDDRVLSLRNLSFGIKDAFKGLLSGASVFPFDIKKDGLSLLPDLIIREGLTYYASTPSIFRYFISELSGKETFPSLRVIQLGGEPLSKREVESYKKHFTNNCVLLHHLSAGEAGNLCQYFINKETEISTSIVSVGYPVRGKEVFLVDENWKKIGIDQVGEIAVRSRYLSSEYWRKPELTSAKFLPDPSGGDERIYLTGDLGRMLPDGRLVYLGRKDLEVKIRGSKVAITEIEMALRDCAYVKDAAVTALDDQSGEKCLVAYVVPREAPGPKINELGKFLREKLPDYMIPAKFVYLESLPSINGKLDRRALPHPDYKRPDLSYPYVPPRNEVEQKLILIWEEVLGVSPIGIHDNFFDLGGHSLAATRVVSRVIKQFRLELPLQSLFQSPTVAEMAAVIDERQKNRLTEEELERILSELEALSEEEAKKLGGEHGKE
jgi:amino acid adenylation domain-containing protein